MAQSTVTRKSAKSLTGKSPSDVSARTPVAQAASANGSGHHGAALAVVFIHMAEEQGAAKATLVNAQAKSNKDKLADLFNLTADDHVAFRNALESRMEAIRKEAEKVHLKIMDYRAANPKDDYIYVNLSTWKGMSTAVQNGWKPDLDDKGAIIASYAELRSQASKYNDGAKARAAQAKISEQIAKVQADPKMEPELKAATVKVLEAQIKDHPVTTGTKTPAKPKTLIELVDGLVKDRPVQELEELLVWLGQKIVTMYKPGARVVNSTLKNVEAARTGAPAPTAPAANENQERAVAKGDKRTAKGRSRK